MNEEEPQKKSCNWLYVKIVVAGVGLFSGILIFCTFLFVYWNYNAALWGLASGFFAAFVLHLHILFLKNALHRVYSSNALKFMKLIGMFATLVSCVAIIMYIVLAALQKQGYQIHGLAYAPAATFSFMTLKWTGSLWYESGKYYRTIVESTSVKHLLSGPVKPDTLDVSTAEEPPQSKC